MTILPSVTLHINRAPFFTFTFHLKTFTHIFSLHTFICVLHLLHTPLRIFLRIHLNPTQKWPDLMNPSLLPRKISQNIRHPRNTNPNLGKSIMNILEDLGRVMNAMKNFMKFLGRIHTGRMNKSRNSLATLSKYMNSLRLLGKSKQGKPRGKGK